MSDEARQTFEPGEALESLSRDELIAYAQLCSKNLFAIDGTWFQSIEAERGMDEAGAPGSVTRLARRGG